GRAITAQDGRLLGFVTLSMELSSFEELFARIVVSKESTIALWRDDGILLARYPHQEAGIGRPYGSQPEFQRSMAARDRSVVHHNSIIDGSERLVAPHSV